LIAIMPKCSPAKRRKKEAASKDDSKQSEKVKQKHQDSEKTAAGIEDDPKDENVDHSDNDDACAEQSLDIDQSLDRNASKSNLSVFNVKSIIHVSMITTAFETCCYRRIYRCSLLPCTPLPPPCPSTVLQNLYT
jgi:hypothetical protein